MKIRTDKNLNFLALFYSFFLFVPMLLAQAANASTIQYTLTSLGDNNYRYTYTITNDGALGIDTAIEGFFISFDPTLYDEDSLDFVTPEPLASDWDEMILGSGIGVPADYDALAEAGGIDVGESISGFAVEFAWLGSGAPGAQPFEIYDLDSFDTIDTGMTTLFTSPPETSEIPEPGTLFLLLAAFVACFTLQQYKSRANYLSTKNNN